MDELLDLADGVLTEIEERTPGLTCALEDAHRIYAAAALVRSASIVRSSIAAVNDGHPVAAGILVRPAWETWLAGSI